MTTSSPTKLSTNAAAWLGKHRHNVIILGIVALIVLLQWPAIKGVFYRAVGAPYPADNIAWRSDFRAALDESTASGKFVLLDFTASWCPPCQVMKRETWPDPEVGRLIAASYVPVLIDVDDVTKQDIAQGYGVATIPTVIIVDGKGAVLKKADYLSRDAMVKFLKDIPTEHRAL